MLLLFPFGSCFLLPRTPGAWHRYVELSAIDGSGERQDIGEQIAAAVQKPGVWVAFDLADVSNYHQLTACAAATTAQRTTLAYSRRAFEGSDLRERLWKAASGPPCCLGSCCAMPTSLR